jgi:cell division protein FtsB
MHKDPKTGIIGCEILPFTEPRVLFDPNHGLIAWYPLDGNASDVSGNSRHGTIYGATPTEDRHGKKQAAYAFDGIDDYIKINHDKAFNHLPLTISTWFKSLGNPGAAGIVSKYWAAHWNGWQIMDKEGDLVPWYLKSLYPRNVIIGKYGENKTFETKTPIGSWNHALVTFSDKGGFLFLNGKIIDSKKWTGQPSAPTTNQPVMIGRYQGVSNGFFNGCIDDVRIYDRALSEEEVLALYELESTDPNDGRPTPPPLPGTGGLTPPDPDYTDTMAELKRLLAEKDKKLAHCEMEMAAKNKQIGSLTSENAKLQGEVKSLSGKVTGLEKQVASLTTDNEGLKGQVKNLREENQNVRYELTITNEHLEKAIHAAETPFINGWVYDPALGWLFTDADHFPLVYTHKDETWHYYELGSSNPRYFFNYKTQEWVAWDPILRENEQVIVKK